MSKPITAIKWYLTGLFSYPTIIMILAIVLLQYLALSQHEFKVMSLMEVSSLFLFPFYGFANEIHFIREKDQTILEITFLRSWKWVVLGKTIVGIIGILPLLIVEYIVLSLNNLLSYAVPFTLLLITYVILGTLLSVLQSKSYGLFLVFVFFFLIPLGIFFTINSILQQNITPPEYISFLFYYFATPLAQYYLSERIITGNFTMYTSLDILLDIILLMISVIVFLRSEIK